MNVEFRNLIKVQESVDKVVYERLAESGIEKPSPINILTAMHVELFEFINAVGTWKWWKQNQTVNREKVLDELADIVAFFLSLCGSNGPETMPSRDKAIDEYIEAFSKYDNDGLLQFLSSSIESGVAKNHLELISLSVVIAANTIDGLTWSDIENAYLQKSEENIKRQQQNY